MSDMSFRRLRRLRRTPALRTLVRETRLSTDDFIYPLFIAEREHDAGPVRSMPGVVRHTLDSLEREIEQVAARKIRSVLLFGIPAGKDATGSGAYAEDGVIPQAIRRIKAAREDMIVVTDVCLCEYTDHGHCGLIHEDQVDNDATLQLLAQTAVAHAAAGADLVAPSAMMDGMVGAIRRSLDGAGHNQVGILSYAVKYASSFYGPFREAADCAPKFGDRRTHQMDPANVREALAEAEEDLREGADLLMVKPGMPYLDVLSALRQRFPQAPLAAYQVSGEYSMIKAAAGHGWLDERRVVLESLTAIKRAGADIIITYFAKDAAEYLAQAHD
ncbi:MAG TPA: porphobilinogen synthase [Phycisphaerae bacterium]|nr:porphobilinogen synthase [Phycisphaerae bacterium]